MKKTFLSITAVLFSTIIANAQAVPEVTTYRGAFAPSPTRQWTESWTNFDPKNTVYPATTVNIAYGDSIVTPTTWTSNNVYRLDSIIYVKSTLTIEPGTIIRGLKTKTALVVVRGGKLIAEGTPCNPIVFTSNDAPGASRSYGDWGGVILLGKAKHNLGTNNLIEGLEGTNQSNYHGGTDDNDNSGVLRYVRIEFPGFVFSPNNEINGLTMGSVGRGTTIDHIQVSYSDDDSYEWFGGSVDCNHLVAFRGKDDDWDTDNGFSGLVQYGLSIRDRNISDASQSEGFESDNSATGVDGLLPKTSAKFYNITQIGGFPCASNADGSGVAPSALFLHRRGARVRRNSDLKIYNSILMNNWRGLFVDDAIVSGNPTAPTSVNFNEDSAAFRNNIIAGDFTTTWTGTTYNGTKSLAFETPTSRTIGLNAAYAIDSVNTCSLLTDAWNAVPDNADFRPNSNFVSNDPLITSNPVTDATKLTTGANLSAGVTGNPLFTANQSRPVFATILENSGGATNGIITVIVPKPSAWAITVPGITLSGTPTSGISGGAGASAYTNGNWNFSDDGTNVIATSKPGTIIAKDGFVRLRFDATRGGTTSAGTNQNVSVTISGGGDTTPSNNTAVITLSAN